MFRRRNRPVYAPKVRYSPGQPLALWERYYERGLDHFKKGKLAEAVADLDEAIENMPRNGELYAARGLILAELGRKTDAEEDLDYALQIDARQWMAHYGKALLAYRAKNYDAAIEQLTIAQRFAPLRPEILYTRACAFYERGDVQRANLDMDSASQLMNEDDKRNKEAKKFLKRLQKELK